jgi:hypothetical protein
MGMFLTITYEQRFAGTHAKNRLISRVVDYIADYLQDNSWQDSISPQLRNTAGHLITLSIILRFFDIKNIEAGKLKSYARYKKKDNKLIIDQMLVLNEYADLQEDEMRKKICDDIFDYLEEILTKYKDRFLDFDAIAFIPLLKERIEKIKANEFPFDYYENQEGAQSMKQRADSEEEIINFEKTTNIKFPALYASFLVHISKGDVWEIGRKGICLYSIFDLAERNETYEIKKYGSDFFMIGQNGDSGYFINAKNHTDEAIYSNDLGALGSLEMEKEADDIHAFWSKFK